jgi:hypothetical protein
MISLTATISTPDVIFGMDSGSNRLREPSNGSIKKGSHSLSMRKTMTTSETSIFRNSVGKPNLCTAAFEGLHYA